MGSFTYKGTNFTNAIKVADIDCDYGRCINYKVNMLKPGLSAESPK